MSDIYKDAGVDVQKGYESVSRMKKHIAETKRPEVMGEIGSFAGLFDLSSSSYQEPVLVSGTDGVGTKLKLSQQLQKYDTVGIDLVAMCVNDVVAQGAEPLFFLDYIAIGKNDPEIIEQIVSGIASGCKQAGSSLIGGETAEMPGMYAEDEFDLAGFVVGIAEKVELITGKDIQTGDKVIGLASSGIHSNGYSLVRKLIDGMDVNQMKNSLRQSLGETLLSPTRIYASAVAKVKKNVPLKGISHITGGGFYENFPRMLPDGLGVELDAASWRIPEIFPFLQETGNIPEEEMYGVFNMGIGMAMVVDEKDAQSALDILAENDEEAYLIGEVTASEGVYFRS